MAQTITALSAQTQQSSATALQQGDGRHGGQHASSAMSVDEERLPGRLLRSKMTEDELTELIMSHHDAMRTRILR